MPFRKQSDKNEDLMFDVFLSNDKILVIAQISTIIEYWKDKIKDVRNSRCEIRYSMRYWMEKRFKLERIRKII